MQVFRTTSAALSERMDAGHYLPVYVENTLKLKSRGVVPFREVYRKTGIGHTASVEPHYEGDGTGVSFISGTAIKAGQLSVDDAQKIKRESHLKVMTRSQLRPGFLLVVRKGEVGAACVVPEEVAEANCSSE